MTKVLNDRIKTPELLVTAVHCNIKQPRKGSAVCVRYYFQSQCYAGLPKYRGEIVAGRHLLNQE